MGEPKLCEECRCFNGTHGGCNSRGHDPKSCHGIHTLSYCHCECCCQSPDPPTEEEA